jgi:hypothetical protein
MRFFEFCAKKIKRKLEIESTKNNKQQSVKLIAGGFSLGGKSR